MKEAKIKRRSFLKMVGTALTACVLPFKAKANTSAGTVATVEKTIPFEHKLREDIHRIEGRGLTPRHIYVNGAGYEYLQKLGVPRSDMGQHPCAKFDSIPISISPIIINDKPRLVVVTANPIFDAEFGQWDDVTMRHSRVHHSGDRMTFNTITESFEKKT